MSLYGHLLPGTFFIFFGVWWSFVTAIRFVLSKQRSPFKKNGELVGYRSTATMPCICLPIKRLRHMPIESMLKVFFTAVGIMGEMYTGRHWQTLSIPLGHSSSPYSNFNSNNINNTIVTTTSTSANMMPHEHMHEHTRREIIYTPDHQTKYFNFHYPGVGLGYMQHITMYSAFLLGGVVEILMHYGHELPAGLDYGCGSLGFTIEAFIFNSHLHGKGMVDAFLHVLLVWFVFTQILGV
jgi:hypothetical protein